MCTVTSTNSATPEYVVDDHRTIDLRGTTDHPGLLVTLTRAAP